MSNATLCLPQYLMMFGVTEIFGILETLCGRWSIFVYSSPFG